MWHRIPIITMLLVLIPQVAFALAQAPPSIFLGVNPTSQDVPVGSSAEFRVSVYPQGAWNEGIVSFELIDPPEGVTAVFEPETIEFTLEGSTIMTVNVASDAPLGQVTLKVAGSGKETRVGDAVYSDAEVELNILEPTQKPEETKPFEPEQVKTVTVTVTSISFRSISTTTVVSSVTFTVTQVLTTRTPTIGTSTTVEQVSQVGDMTFPIVVLGAVLVLLSVAFIALRRR